MLQELCDGHPGFSVEVYALDLPNGVRLWMCKSCWVRAWIDAGRPAQRPVAAARLAEEENRHDHRSD